MSGPAYTARGVQTLIAAPADSALSVTVNATTAHRMWLYDVYMGNHGTPDDAVSFYVVGQITAIGTGTAITPTLKNPSDDRAAQAVGTYNHTTEPTYTDTGTDLAVPGQGDMIALSLNHRSVYRWVAPPGGEFVAPATANAGWGGKADHASKTTDYNMAFAWYE